MFVSLRMDHGLCRSREMTDRGWYTNRRCLPVELATADRKPTALIGYYAWLCECGTVADDDGFEGVLALRHRVMYDQHHVFDDLRFQPIWGGTSDRHDVSERSRNLSHGSTCGLECPDSQVFRLAGEAL